MDYKIEYPEKNTAVIYVTVDKEEWQEDLKTAAEVTKTEDANANREYAISAAAGQALSEAVAKENLKVASQPSLTADDNEDGSVSITLTVPLVPEVKLGAYTGLDLEKAGVSVTEEEVLSHALAAVNQQKIWDTLPADTPAEKGDQVIIDFVGEKDGVPFEGGTGKDYPLILGSGSFIPGFEDQLIGAKAGEKVDVNVTFPADYFEPSLAGQPVVFHCTVKEVQKEIKPEMSDAFIERMQLEGVKTVDDLMARAKADMIAMKEQEAENDFAMRILDKVAANAEVEIPQTMIDNQVRQHMAQYEQQLQQYGMNFAEFLKASGQTEEEFQSRLIPQAEQEIRSALVLEAIADKEEIKATNEEIEDEYKLLTTVYRFPAEQLKMLISEASVAYQVAQRKTLDFLKASNEKKAA